MKSVDLQMQRRLHHTPTDLCAMAWRRIGVGEDEAMPLAASKKKAPPSTDKQLRDGKYRISKRISGAGADAPHKRMTDDELAVAKKSHEENVVRAQEAAKRNMEKQRILQQAQQKRDLLKPRRDTHVQSVVSRQSYDASKQQAENVLHLTECGDHRAHHVTSRSSKRLTNDMGTVSSCRTIAPLQKRSTCASNEFILVWREDCAFGTPQRDSLVDRALQEGPCVTSMVDMAMVTSSLRDGICISSTDNGNTFFMPFTDKDPWCNSIKWKEFISPIKLKKNGTIVEFGGTCGRRIGCGTFNCVASFPPTKMPHWMPVNTAHRFTRPDKDPCGIDSKYQNEKTTTNEIKNAIFSSINGIGVKVYNIACFSAPREGRTLRYGMVMSLERGECDLLQAMANMNSEHDGIDVAEKCIDLLYRVSRCGVAFFDIKPANILVFKVNDGGTSLRITDYDPAFFLHVPGEDWRTLLLLNLCLLSTHVHNSCFGAVGRGFAKGVAPTLRQLIRRRDDFDSDWLFAVRCVMVNFGEPRGISHFDLQKLFAGISTSYFFDPTRTGPAIKHSWKNRDDNQRTLNAHWETPLHRNRWPDSWEMHESEPLVKQMVDFCLEYA